MTSPTVIDDTHLTVAQTADRLGVSERTVWRYLKAGRLDGITVGELGSQRTLIPCDSVAAVSRRRDAADTEARLAEATAQVAGLRAECERLQARIDVLHRALVRRAGAVWLADFVQTVRGALTRGRISRTLG